MLCGLSSGTILAQSAQTPAEGLSPVLYSLEGQYHDAESSQYQSLQDAPCNVIWEGDSVVWFDNLFPDVRFPDGSSVWVKGVVEYSIRITIHPQVVYRMTMNHDGMEMEHEYSVGTIDGSLDACTGYSDYQFVNNTRDHKLEPIYKDAIFALYDQTGTIYSAGKQINIEEVGDALVSVPEGVESSPFLMHYTDQKSGQTMTSICHIAIKDNQAWIQGLCRSIPEAWVKGLIGDFGTISLEFGQLLGAYEHESILYFVGVRKAEGTISNLSLAFQSDGSYLLSPEYMVAESTLGLVAYGAYGDIDIRPTDCTAVAPKDPWNLQIAGSYEEYPYFAFQYEAAGQNGEWLINDSLYYQVYVDDELFTFQPHCYPSLSEATDRIPCLYADDEEFVQYSVMGSNALPVFLLRKTNAEWHTLGVKLLYQCFGQELSSQIITIANPDADIKAIDSEPDKLIRYDFMGRSLSGGSRNGLCIEQTVGADGKIRVTKKLYR